MLCRAQLKSRMFLSVYRDSFSFLFLLTMYSGVISIYKNNNEKKNPLLNLILICYIWQTNKRRIKQKKQAKKTPLYIQTMPQNVCLWRVSCSWLQIQLRPYSLCLTYGSHIAKARKIPILKIFINVSIFARLVAKWFMCDYCVSIHRWSNSKSGRGLFLILIKILLLLHWTDKVPACDTQFSRRKAYQGTIR